MGERILFLSMQGPPTCVCTKLSGSSHLNCTVTRSQARKHIMNVKSTSNFREEIAGKVSFEQRAVIGMKVSGSIPSLPI